MSFFSFDPPDYKLPERNSYMGYQSHTYFSRDSGSEDYLPSADELREISHAKCLVRYRSILTSSVKSKIRKELLKAAGDEKTSICVDLEVPFGQVPSTVFSMIREVYGTLGYKVGFENTNNSAHMILRW